MASYLGKTFFLSTKKERDKLIYGDELVKVSSQELACPRIDTYPYLM